MSKRRTLQCDLWGNITYYNNLNKWVRQEFIGKTRINYEDSTGNCWNADWGTPFIFDNYVNHCDIDPLGEKIFLIEKRSSHKSNQNIYITTTSFWMPTRDAVMVALRAPLIDKGTIDKVLLVPHIIK